MAREREEKRPEGDGGEKQMKQISNCSISVRVRQRVCECTREGWRIRAGKLNLARGFVK
jgi:hypothetical protein